MTATDNDDEAWEEWEEDTDLTVTQACIDSNGYEKKAEMKAIPTVPNFLSSDEEKEGLDLSKLEHEMKNLPGGTNITCFHALDGANSTEKALILALDDLPQTVRAHRERVQTLEALALVTQLHRVAVRGSFGASFPSSRTNLNDVERINQELTILAGEWGDTKLLEGTISATERQELQAMTERFQDVLAATEDDLTLFQQVIEQIFSSLPNQELRVSSTWLEKAEKSSIIEKRSYVEHVETLFRDDFRHIPSLSKAEIFQDAKDIVRDELVINGARVDGQKGYDAVVDALERELELVLARQVGQLPEKTPMSVSHALQSVAMAVLHASNRTESGGTSYELLRTFLSDCKLEKVLLRPDSARAAPLELVIDVGPYLDSLESNVWAFGLRVKLLAVTWYLVCDALDPMKVLKEIKTTFSTRLAFPVGLTPFHPLDSMRRDRGDVIIHLASNRAHALEDD